MNNKQRAAQLAEFLEDFLDQQERIADKLDELSSQLDALLDTIGKGRPDSEPPSSTPRPEPKRTKEQEQERERKKERNIAESSYLRIVIRVVGALLKPEAPPVGKLTYVLQKELGEPHSSFLLAIRRLTERETFVVMSEAARGQPAYVRIKDRAAAEAWLVDARERYKKMMALEHIEGEEEG